MSTIILLPPDERPNTGGFAHSIGSCFGHEVLIPPPDAMPSFMQPADTSALANWLRSVQSSADQAVISLDLLVHGGLIPSRNTADTVTDVVPRLAVLEELSLPVTAYQVVQRMPPYNNGTRSRQEPEYWAQHGADLGEFSRTWHQHQHGEATANDVARTRSAIPCEHLTDAMNRRLRNHITNLAALELAARGKVETLVVTSDDTSPRSLPAADRHSLESWIDRTGLDVLTYPGADEVPSVLTARVSLRLLEMTPFVAVVCAEDDGLTRIAPFEDGPVLDGILRQIRAAGAQPVADPDQADLVFVVHAPDPARQVWGSRPPTEDTTELSRDTAALAAKHLNAGRTVAVADVRYANGGDPRLIWALEDQSVLTSIASYSGWNTAGNSIGTALAAGLAAVCCSTDAARTAQRAFLVRKIVEDGHYLPSVRLAIQREAAERGLSDPPLGEIPDVESRITADLDAWTRSVPSLAQWKVARARLPWRYTFTVDFDLLEKASVIGP